MQSFLGGDKGGSTNPFKQISNREAVDRSVFQDRFAPPGQSSRRTPSHQATQPVENSQATHLQAQTPHPFNLSHLASSLAGPSSQDPTALQHTWESTQRQHHSSQQQQHWGNEYQPQQSGWANGFQSHGKGKGRAVFQDQQVPDTQMAESFATTNGIMQPRGYGLGSNMNAGMGMGMGMIPFQSNLQPMYQNYQSPQSHQALNVNGGIGVQRGNEKEMEEAYEKAFKNAQNQFMKDQETHDGVVKDDVLEQKMEDEKMEERDGIEDRGESKGDFEKVWESLRPEAERLGKLAEWEKEFSQFTNDEDDLFDTLNDSLNRDDVGQHSLDDQLNGLDDSGLTRPDLSGYLENENGIPNLQPYEFVSPDRFSDLSPIQALIQARAILSAGGSLTSATNLLESFLQRASPEEMEKAGVSEVEVWTLLGRTHAMNEKEEKALSAFAQGRKSLQDNQSNAQTNLAGELLTNLAISYVNESLDLAALTVLHEYLTILSPQKAGPAPNRNQISESAGPWALHQSLLERFLDTARNQYQVNGGVVDPDVQVGLGTLYYMMGEYGDARDCWVNALDERPDDYLLWNRLGATLANGGNPEEAVDAYRRALELRPTFTRAIFNLGIACLNIGVYREAAEHFLAALSMHDKTSEGGGGIMYESTSLWATLRRALSALDLDDLAARAIPGADLRQFKAAGFDF